MAAGYGGFYRKSFYFIIEFIDLLSRSREAKKLVRVFCTNTTKTLKLFPKMGIFAIDHIAAGSKCDPL